MLKNLIVLLIATGACSAQTAGSAMPFVKPQFFDNGGRPAASYKACFYSAGTTTPRVTYTTSALNVANANPVVLDASGRASIFFAVASYKVTLLLPTSSTTDCVTGTMSAVWTQDNIANNADLLKAALAGANGASLVGYTPPGATSGTTVKAELDGGFLLDTGMFSPNTLAGACAAAVAHDKTLAITQTWAAQATETLACNLFFLTGGMIQPASGQTVTLASCPIGASSARMFDGTSGGILSIPVGCTLTDYNFGVKADGSTDDTAAHNFAFQTGWKSAEGAGRNVLTLLPPGAVSMVQPGQVFMTSNTSPANCRTSGGNCNSVASYECPGNQTVTGAGCVMRAISGTPNAANYVLDAQGMIHAAIKGLTFDGNATAECLNADNPLQGGSPNNSLTGRCTNRYGIASSTVATGGGVSLANWNDSFGAMNFIIDGTGAGYTMNVVAGGGGCNFDHIQSATGNAAGQAYFDCQNLHIKDSYLKSGLRSGLSGFNYWQIDGQTQIEADSITGTVIDWRPISSGGGGWGLDIMNTILAPSGLPAGGRIFVGQFQAGVRMYGGRIVLGLGALFGAITEINAQIPTFEFWGTNFDTLPTFTYNGASNYYFICHNCWRLDTNVVFSVDTRPFVGFGGATGFYGSSSTSWVIGHQNFPASFAITEAADGTTSIKSEAGKTINLFVGATQVGNVSSGGMNLSAGETFAINGASFSGTVIAGACHFTIEGGIITNVTGC